MSYSINVKHLDRFQRSMGAVKMSVRVSLLVIEDWKGINPSTLRMNNHVSQYVGLLEDIQFEFRTLEQVSLQEERLEELIGLLNTASRELSPIEAKELLSFVEDIKTYLH